MDSYAGFSLPSSTSRRAVKRKWREITRVATTAPAPRGPFQKVLISFSDGDFLLGEANEGIPLIIAATVAGVKIERILVDQSSTADIIFQDLLPAFGLAPGGLIPYLGPSLTVLGEKIVNPLAISRHLSPTVKGDSLEL